MCKESRAVTQTVSSRSGFSQGWPGFDLRPGHEGFVVDKVLPGRVSLRVIRLYNQFSFLINYNE
jgi:hypothetical protein